MEGVSTDSLRALAPKWSLAGDDQLLNLLQKTHERIISKCQDVNVRLDEMASALDDASINLHNVNNKFMALSNSQFIESRVYDDDADLNSETTPAKVPVQETVQPPAVDEISMLRSSLAVLERAHEAAEILDDSDSDSDAEISVVLKPRDMYADRPLPYIIGSQQWRNKWHAGLIVEDSDTDSSTSKRNRDMDQYSDSESEEITRAPLEDNTLSESGSSLGGSVGAPATVPAAPGWPAAAGAPPAAGAAASPADIAAALARRLAAPHMVVQEPEDTPPETPPAPTVRKVYKPEAPATSTIFSDEPPPLECGADSHSSDDDIFAEINKHTPYTQKNPVQSNVTDDLFSFDKPPVEEGDIFRDFAPENVNIKPVKQKSPLFEGESEPELFAEPPPKKDIAQKSSAQNDEPSSKKPVGGISLFGSNKGTESIGAAILKRNQRKSSTSDDDSGSDNVKNQTDNISKPIVQNEPKDLAANVERLENRTIKNTTDETDNKSVTSKEKDIFEDLFSKPDNQQKKAPQKPVNVPAKNNVTSVRNKVIEKEKTNVKDLFSDNIFDDIDDIFTSNVKLPIKESNKSNQKSIFDDDDLFSDIDTAKINQNIKGKTSIKTDPKIAKEKKSIFDSDDDLFSDVKSDSNKRLIGFYKEAQSEETKSSKESGAGNLIIEKTDTIRKIAEIDKEESLFDESAQTPKTTSKPQIINKSIFDSDSEDDNIFAKIKTSHDEKSNKPESILNHNANQNSANKEESFKSKNNTNLLQTDNSVPKEKSKIQSPSLFEEDEIDDLFIAANKVKSQFNEQKDIVTEDKHLPSFEKESVTTSISKIDVTNALPEQRFLANKNSSEKTNKPKVENKTKQDNQNVILTESPKNYDIVEDDLFTSPKIASQHISTVENIEDLEEIIESSQDITVKNTKEASKKDSRILNPESRPKHNETIRNDNITTEYLKPEQETTNKTNLNDLLEKEKEAVTSELKVPISNTDILDDIFTEPPAFEKPVESKKSKNINALFDDDSDDESLFFKKNDVISDEKPEIFSSNANFDIFVNEPPAIDIDFTTKSSNKIEVVNTENDLFSPVTKSKNLTTDEDNFFSETNKSEKQNISQLAANITDNENELFTSVTDRENVPTSTVTHINRDNEVVSNIMKEDLYAVVPELQNVPANKNHEVIKEHIEDKPTAEIFESKTQSNLFADIEDNDLFTPETENLLDNKVINVVTKDIDSDNTKVDNVINKSSDSDEELFATLSSLTKSSHNNNQNDILKSNVNADNINNMGEIDDIFKSKESPRKESDVKKIGKLNTKNFNINVNALIPGASPKKDKQKSIDEPKIAQLITGETSSDTMSANKAVNDVTDQGSLKIESKNENVVTFDEKSESGVLDNNVSKQRARIQVKRRPSSRKARHEAARRSAIGFGDDTDNSSSFDEPRPKAISTENPLLEKDLKIMTHLESNSSKSIQKDETENVNNIPNNTEIEKTKENSELNKNIFESNANVIESDTYVDKSEPTNSSGAERKDLREVSNDNKPTTTKIVYILNDEDIFNTDSKKLVTDLFEPNNETDSKSEIIEDDLFKSTQGIKTIGNTYKTTQNPNEITKTEGFPTKPNKEVRNQEKTTEKEEKSSQKDKLSLFDDSEEELFRKKTSVKKKTTIFDSDSEEELFSGKKSKEKNNKEQKNKEVKEKKEVIVKSSLFSDDDDDDLFGLKKDNKNESKPKSLPSTSKEMPAATTASKSAEPVFDDPLSMLGSEE